MRMKDEIKEIVRVIYQSMQNLYKIDLITDDFVIDQYDASNFIIVLPRYAFSSHQKLTEFTNTLIKCLPEKYSGYIKTTIYSPLTSVSTRLPSSLIELEKLMITTTQRCNVLDLYFPDEFTSDAFDKA